MDELIKFLLHPILTLKIGWIYATNGGKDGIDFLKDFERANELMVAGHLENSVIICDRLISSPIFNSKPASVRSDIYIVRAMANKKLKRVEDAKADCLAALKIEPEKLLAHETLGLIFLKESRAEEAKTCFDRALRIDPKNHRSYVNRAGALIKMGLPKEALEDCKSALALVPNSPNALANIVSAKIQLNMHEDALVDCQNLLELDPQNKVALVNRGVIYMKLRRSQEAIADFDAAIKAGHYTAEVFASRGGVYLNLKQLDKAIADCDKSLELDKNCSAASINRSRALRKLERWDEAIQACEMALKRPMNKQDTARTYSDLAGIYVRTGDSKLALENCALALKADPDNPSALNVRAWALGHLGKFDEAYLDVENALRQRSDIAAYLGTCGFILFGLGRYEKAIEQLDKALEKEPSDGESLFFRAEARKKLGDTAQADADYAKAAELDYKLPKLSIYSAI
jgi:tetratricopeptide (TPR) repeat protein